MSASAFTNALLNMFHGRREGVTGWWVVPEGVRKDARRTLSRLERRRAKLEVVRELIATKSDDERDFIEEAYADLPFARQEIFLDDVLDMAGIEFPEDGDDISGEELLDEVVLEMSLAPGESTDMLREQYRVNHWTAMAQLSHEVRDTRRTKAFRASNDDELFVDED